MIQTYWILGKISGNTEGVTRDTKTPLKECTNVTPQNELASLE